MVPPAVQAMMVEYDTEVAHYAIVDIYQAHSSRID